MRGQALAINLGIRLGCNSITNETGFQKKSKLSRNKVQKLAVSMHCRFSNKNAFIKGPQQMSTTPKLAFGIGNAFDDKMPSFDDVSHMAGQ
jgi:hypothetical protein